MVGEKNAKLHLHVMIISQKQEPVCASIVNEACCEIGFVIRILRELNYMFESIDIL